MAESPDRLHEAPPDRVVCRYHGRDFTAGEMRLLRELIAGRPARHRAQLSREFCPRIQCVVGQIKPTRIRRIIRSRLRLGWSHYFVFADRRRPADATAVG